MAERSATFDTFKQHTYVPNKLYSVLNLARAAILDDLAAEIQTAAPGHSAAAGAVTVFVIAIPEA